MDVPVSTDIRPRRPMWILTGLLLIAILWCGVLLTLVLTTANPPVLNRVQIQGAPIVAEGLWQPGNPPTLTISRVWKGTLSPQTVTLSRPYPESIPVGPVIVPLTSDVVHGVNVYQVTHGELLNLPQSPMAPPADPREWLSQVRPMIYPATPQVLKELQQLLSEKKARSALLVQP